MTEPVERFLPKPVLLDTLEARIGRAIPVHPHVLSLLKLLIVTPLIAAGLLFGVEAWRSSWAVIGLFCTFGALDSLDGIVARARGLDTDVGRLVDRVTDLPLLLIVGYVSFSVLPPNLVIAKVALDLLSLVLFVVKRRTTENRVRTTLTDATVLAMLLLSLGRLDGLVTRELVVALLTVNVGFTALVVAFQIGVLQKRFIADALSGVNALCGVSSIYFASQHQIETSLLLLLAGAAFDGLDGAAARKWGGTRFGVYSDDIADGINYAIAPGVALAYGLGGVEGIVVGAVYSTLTISRLVFFTLNKDGSDPHYFAGVPSTIGGLVALSSLLLFRDSPSLVGLFVGIAAVLMVSFDSAYRHLGRMIFAASRAKALVGLSAAVVLLGGGVLFGVRIPAGVILACSLAYGFVPQVARFRALLAEEGVAMRARLERLRALRSANLLVVNLRLLLGFAFLPAGLKKVLGQRFTDAHNVGAFHEFLHAFFATGFFYRFVGALQLTVALLLMTQTLGTLGALLSLPIFTAITVLCFSTGAVFTGVMTTLMMLAALLLSAWEYERFIDVLRPLPLGTPEGRKPVERGAGPPPIDLRWWRACGVLAVVLYLSSCVLSGGIYRPRGLELQRLEFYVFPLMACLPIATWAGEQRRRRA